MELATPHLQPLRTILQTRVSSWKPSLAPSRSLPGTGRPTLVPASSTTITELHPAATCHVRTAPCLFDHVPTRWTFFPALSCGQSTRFLCCSIGGALDAWMIRGLAMSTCIFETREAFHKIRAVGICWWEEGSTCWARAVYWVWC